MATYSKKKLLKAHPSQIKSIAEAIYDEFESDGYDVNVDALISGGRDISITKGGMFKAVLGMRSALKVALIPSVDGVKFEANVGIYGQQAIPTVISMFFFWPVLLTQIWGMVQQSKLDDRALEIAERVIAESPSMTLQSNDSVYCTHCGTKNEKTAKFCHECGEKM